MNPSSLTAEDLDPIYTYDLNGNRTSMIDPTGLTTYAYDALNRLTSITNNKGQTTTFAYDALSRRTSMTHANGVVTTYTYDVASQLTRLAHQFGANSINAFDYVYDRVGNRTSKASRDGAHNYTYDTLNRLTQAVNPLPTNPLETFNYDPVGNRTGSNQNGASIFNTANQLLEDANFTYQYDNNGNQTRKTAKIGGAVTQHEYDAENKLVRVVSPTNIANYKYDGLGRRVEKEVIAGTTAVTKYVYDKEGILLELDGSNQILARYTHGARVDEPLVMEKNGQSFYFHADALGSISDLTSQTGMIVQRYTYSSYGKVESQLDPKFGQPFRFTAREFEPDNGLFYYRMRYYDSASGRFLQEDAIRSYGLVSSYNYVRANPTLFRDPSGLRVLNPKNYPIQIGILNALEFLNDLIGCDKDIVITGGDRPSSSKLGAQSTSQHVVGQAADFYIPGQSNLLSANQAYESGIFGGIGWYEEGYWGPNGEGPHVHVDLRDFVSGEPVTWGLPRSSAGTSNATVGFPYVPVPVLGK